MRVRIFAVIILFFFATLILGLFYTQILKYNVYTELAETNRIRPLALASPRGKIYDRKGRLLVSNRISFDVEVIFQEIKDRENAINLLSGILNVDKKILAKRIDASREMPFIPVKIAEDIGKEKAIRVEEARLGLPGVIVTTRPLRNYLYSDVLSHVIGYLGEISEEELRRYRTYGYRMRDFVGKDGVERTFNDYLRGIDGGLQVEVDSRGRQLEILAVREPKPGRDIYLSVDIELQEFCETLMDDRNGAIVAMNPSTGAILALVSHPDFDPNIFVRPNNVKGISNLLNDSQAFPMVNRAISGTYPPGSVFKIVIASAALESGRPADKKMFSCSGSFPVGRRRFHCWSERGHGQQDIREAVKNSCNVFFYQLGLSLGVNTISEYAFKFGFGKPTGIDLPGETAGLVPTPAWKRKKLREPWFKGETANYSIGQGFIAVTPIQILQLVSTVANGGKLAQPFVVERIEDVKLSHAEPQDIGLEAVTLGSVAEALRMVVNAPRGTGFNARSGDIAIAGKTGTAESPGRESHAWFAGFAPFEKPEITVVVFLEHGGKGGLEPARFAKKIIEKAKTLELL